MRMKNCIPVLFFIFQESRLNRSICNMPFRVNNQFSWIKQPPLGIVIEINWVYFLWIQQIQWIMTKSKGIWPSETIYMTIDTFINIVVKRICHYYHYYLEAADRRYVCFCSLISEQNGGKLLTRRFLWSESILFMIVVFPLRCFEHASV